MNASLQAIGVSARAVLRDGSLHVLLESERVLAPSPSIEFIRRGLSRLGLGWLSSAVVYSRLAGQTSPVWVERVSLVPPSEPMNPFVLEANQQLSIGAGAFASVVPPLRVPLKAIAAPEVVLPEPPWWRQLRPKTLVLLLSGPVVLLLCTTLIWMRYLWGDAPTVPSGGSGAIEQPQGRAVPSGAGTTPSVAGGATQGPQTAELKRALEQGYQAFQRGAKAQNKQDWRDALGHWQQAIAALQAVPVSSPDAAIAKQKQVEYQGHLDFVVREKLSPTGMGLVQTITGGLTPKSVVHSGQGLFFAQNMMYSHTINVYDRDHKLVKTIPDQVKLADYGYANYPGTQQGAPVEAAFSPDGQTAWVSNYQMYGAGFKSTAGDECSPSQNLEPSFLYRIGTDNLAIAKVVQVGAVPKYVETTPNNRYVLASNWCSWDVSVVDPQQNKEIRRIQLGPYPRGIAVEPRSQTAYVAIMGSYDIATINLNDFSVGWIRNVGHSPRHLNMDPQGQFLYATLNGAGQVAKLDLASRTVLSKVSTGGAPRSMAISGDGEFLYVVNYESDSVSKIRTRDMKVVKTVPVNSSPIGITYDNATNRVWVACYSGSILVFQD